MPSSSSPRATESPTMARRLPADPSEAIGTAVVKYNYQAQQPDELSLIKGTRILILEKSNDGFVTLIASTFVIYTYVPTHLVQINTKLILNLFLV